MMKLKIKSEKGFTGADIAVAVLALILFAGVVGQTLYSAYLNNVRIRAHVEATAYLTQMLEYIDEIEYEKVGDSIFDKMKVDLSIPDQYEIKFNVENIDDKADIIKKVNIQISYEFNNGKDSMNITRLKTKEL